MISRKRLVEQLQRLGVQHGAVLLVHTSFRAVRPVAGGPAGLIEALLQALGPEGTLTMPTWPGDDDAPYRLDLPADPDLGVTAEIFRRRSNTLRSLHSEAFSAEGPAAAEVVGDPLPIPPHIPESPVGRVRDLDGQILLLGVGHERNTTLHLAEVMAGVRYGVPAHATVMRDGKPVRIDYLENDHCCRRFVQADDWLRARGLQQEGIVGHAEARLMRSRDLVETACVRLAEDPTVFLHPREAGCAECDEARIPLA